MDGFLTDDVLSPEVTEEFYSEELLRLPHAFYFTPDEAMCAHAVAERPADAPVTFGVFQNFMKINEECLKVWGRILKKLPQAQLILQDAAVDSPLRVTTILEMIEGLKLPAKRIFVRTGKRDYLGDYGDIDIALDTFPYTGGASTATALYMGVPIVSLRGETHHASRLGAAMLTAAGKSAWIAEDARTYENLAVRMAEDIAAVRASRAALRAEVEKSALTDGASYLSAVTGEIERLWVQRGDFAR